MRRQIELIEDGGKVVQETRLYDPDRDETRSMRSKEDAQDYRYFPDPDLLPLVIAQEWIERVRGDDAGAAGRDARALRARLRLAGIRRAVLTRSKAMADYFEAVVAKAGKEQAKPAANWLMGERVTRR